MAAACTAGVAWPRSSMKQAVSFAAVTSLCRSPKGRNVAPPSPTQGIPLKSVGSETTGCITMQSASASTHACSTMLDFPIPGPLQIRTAILAGMVWERSVRSCEGLTAETVFMGNLLLSRRDCLAVRAAPRAQLSSGRRWDRGINGGDPFHGEDAVYAAKARRRPLDSEHGVLRFTANGNHVLGSPSVLRAATVPKRTGRDDA